MRFSLDVSTFRVVGNRSSDVDWGKSIHGKAGDAVYFRCHKRGKEF